MVRANAHSSPDSVAITAGTRHLTYGALWRDASSFAVWLRRSGFRPGDRAAIVLPNSPEAVTACYGAWLAGGVVVLLNAQARPKELAPLLRHCDPALFVHDIAGTDAESLAIDSMPAPGMRA